MKRRLAAAIIFGALVACAETAGAAPPQVGERFEVHPGDLPLPHATKSVSNSAEIVERPDGAKPDVPEGFHVTVFAGGLKHPRWMTVADDGAVFLAEPRADRITLLRDADGDGKAELVGTFAGGLDKPHGLALWRGHLYVADAAGIWRYPYRPGQTRADGPPLKVTARGAFGSRGGHWTRNLVFSPDNRRIYVAIGSARNIAEEKPPRATVQVFDADGGGQRTFATGLRNPVGIAFYPGTDDLYVVVNERDGLGDDLVPDYLTRVRDGDFFGWPYSYTGSHPQPGFADRRPDLVVRARIPDLLFRSHSAPLGLVFYDGKQFPADYRGDAFVALHGSWNAARPRGYMVVRVPFAEGRPVGGYEAFATGFWVGGEDRARVWGRPAGLAVAADGSLLIADDTAAVVWRVSYGP